MELATTYQKLGEAYLGNSWGDLYIRIYAKYSDQDIPNNKTKVQYQARAYYSGNTYILDQQSSGNVKGTSASQVNYSRSQSYPSGETILGTTEAWVEHNPDGTMSVSASAYLNFPNWGWSNTASGTATLPNLHKAPSIGTVSILEQNSALTTLGIANDTIVQYLSKKKFTIANTLYDDATLESCSVYHNNVLIGTSSTNEVVVDFSNVSELLTANNTVGLMVMVVDSLNGGSTKMVNYSAIKYVRPTLESTSTHIKRKTGNGVVLTDNKCNLNFVGTLYKGNDLIGNNNTPTIQYKVWKTSEPSYSNVNASVSDNNVTVTNYEVTNVTYTDVFNYKIKITDSFGNAQEKQDKIPTGISVWSEYTDRVNFLKATVGHKDVLTTDDLIDLTSVNDPDILVNLPSGVIPITPLQGSNYSPYGNSYYYKIGSKVHLHLGLQNLPTNQLVTIFTLPTGYKPNSMISVCGIGSTVNEKVGCQITNNVDIYPTSSFAIIDVEYDAFS